MKRITILLLITVLVLPVLGYAQKKEGTTKPLVSERLRMPTGYGNNFFFGIIDPSKFDMNQSYTMGYFSGTGSSTGYGIYMNRLSYEMSEKVLLNFDLGYVHNPFASFQAPSPAVQGTFIGSGELNYFPRDNMHFQLRVGNFPDYYRYRDTRYGYRR